MTVFAAVFPALVLFGLLVWREFMHYQEAEKWAAERQILLDRVMARDLHEFTSAQVVQSSAPVHVAYMSDEMEAALARRGR